VKSGGHRLLRLLAVFVVFALILRIIVTSPWTTIPDVNSWLGTAPQTDGFAEKDYFPLLPGGDNGHLEMPIGDVLQPDLIPPDVHFIWCGERWFEFKNYLSVMSVRRAIQPDKIYIHYERIPPLDRVYYHQVRHFRIACDRLIELRFYTSHPTQNRSFRRRSSQPISWLNTNKNSSGDEIANVNLLRRYGTRVVVNTATHTYFKIPKNRTYFVSSFSKLNDS